MCDDCKPKPVKSKSPVKESLASSVASIPSSPVQRKTSGTTSGSTKYTNKTKAVSMLSEERLRKNAEKAAAQRRRRAQQKQQQEMAKKLAERLFSITYYEKLVIFRYSIVFNWQGEQNEAAIKINF